MRMRQILAVASVATLALLVGACSGGDDENADEKKETTTTEASTTTESTTTLAPLSDEEFTAKVDTLLAEVEAAGTDLCALFAAVSRTQPAAPAANETQVRAMVDAQVATLRAIGATEPVDAENQAILNKVADDLVAAAEADEYSTEFMTSKEFNDLLNSPEALGALQSYQERTTADCAPPDAAPTEGGAGGAAPATTVAP